MQYRDELPTTLLFREVTRRVVCEVKGYNLGSTWTDFDRAWRASLGGLSPRQNKIRYVTYEVEVNKEIADVLAREINFILERIGVEGNARATCVRGRTYLRGTCELSRKRK